jgi:dTMP kinase
LSRVLGWTRNCEADVGERPARGKDAGAGDPVNTEGRDARAHSAGVEASLGPGFAVPGLFITFEGGEGSGKTTQIKGLLAHLRATGRDAVETRDPGGTPIGKQIRGLLLDPRNAGMATAAELLLYEASRAQVVHEVIRPALAGGCTVLCDRFTDSTVAYQGYGRGLDLDLIAQLNALATEGLRPDLTVLLDLDPTVGLARAAQRVAQQQSRHDRIEEEVLTFHQRVRAGYRAVAAAEPERVMVLDASRGVAEIGGDIRRRVDGLLRPFPSLPGSGSLTFG